MRVGFVQLDSKLLDVEGNVDRPLRLVGRKRAAILVLPELFNTGYNFRTKSEVAGVAESIPDGPTTGVLRDLSRRYGSMIVVGVAEREGTELLQFARGGQGWQVPGNFSQGSPIL